MIFKKRKIFSLAKSVLTPFALGIILLSTVAHSHRANHVWFRILNSGKIRVVVTYTIPELREAREIYVEFDSYKKANAFYWQMVRGGEFYPPDPGQTKFLRPPPGPKPW